MARESAAAGELVRSGTTYIHGEEDSRFYSFGNRGGFLVDTCLSCVLDGMVLNRRRRGRFAACWRDPTLFYRFRAVSL